MNNPKLLDEGTKVVCLSYTPLADEPGPYPEPGKNYTISYSYEEDDQVWLVFKEIDDDPWLDWPNHFEFLPHEFEVIDE